MRDDVYVGNLVSEEEISHSSGPWKKHAYVKKTQEKGYTRYWYPDDIAKNNRKAGGKNPTEEDISNAEEAYNQAAEEYAAAKKAYDANPTPENKKKWDEASKKLDLAGTGQGYADAYRKKQGKKPNLKKALEEEAKRKGKESVMKLVPTKVVNTNTGEDRSKESEDRKKKRKSLSLFNHGVKHTGSKKKEKQEEKKEVTRVSAPGGYNDMFRSRKKNVLPGTAKLDVDRRYNLLDYYDYVNDRKFENHVEKAANGGFNSSKEEKAERENLAKERRANQISNQRVRRKGY